MSPQHPEFVALCTTEEAAQFTREVLPGRTPSFVQTWLLACMDQAKLVETLTVFASQEGGDAKVIEIFESTADLARWLGDLTAFAETVAARVQLACQLLIEANTPAEEVAA